MLRPALLLCLVLFAACGRAPSGSTAFRVIRVDRPSAWAPPTAVLEKRLEAQVTACFKEVELADALQFIRQGAGVPVLIGSPGVIWANGGKPLTLFVKDMPAKRLLTWISRLTNARLVLSGEHVILHEDLGETRVFLVDEILAALRTPGADKDPDLPALLRFLMPGTIKPKEGIFLFPDSPWGGTALCAHLGWEAQAELTTILENLRHRRLPDPDPMNGSPEDQRLALVVEKGILPGIMAEDMLLEDFLEEYHRQTGINFIIDPRLDPAAIPPVTMGVRNVVHRQALDFLMNMTRLTYQIRDGVIFITDDRVEQSNHLCDLGPRGIGDQGKDLIATLAKLYALDPADLHLCGRVLAARAGYADGERIRALVGSLPGATNGEPR